MMFQDRALTEPRLAKWQTSNSCQCAIPYNLSILVMSRCSSNFVHLDNRIVKICRSLSFNCDFQLNNVLWWLYQTNLYNQNILKSNCISNSIGKKYSRDVLARVASDSAQIIYCAKNKKLGRERLLRRLGMFWSSSCPTEPPMNMQTDSIPARIILVRIVQIQPRVL